jgi:hypothetical protein
MWVACSTCGGPVTEGATQCPACLGAAADRLALAVAAAVAAAHAIEPEHAEPEHAEHAHAHASHPKHKPGR